MKLRWWNRIMPPSIKLSPAFCGGLIEAASPCAIFRTTMKLSPAFCGGLIEASGAAPRERQ